jgi:hypothetical protein
MKKILITTLVGLFVLGLAGSAKAVPLTPGLFVTPTGAGLPGGLGAAVASTGAMVSPNNGYLATTLRQDVYMNPGVGLLFVYIFANRVASRDAVTHMSTIDYEGFTTDVDAYQTGVSGDMPYIIGRNLSGATVDFNFVSTNPVDAGVYPGTRSATLWIQTNAQYYTAGHATLLDGTYSQFNVFGPAVPEPCSMTLLGMGILGLFGLKRKKAIV